VWKYILPGLVCLGACSNVTPVPAATQTAQSIPTQTTQGRASYYGGRHNGRMTSSGVIFNSSRMTAAHRTLPFGTMVVVTNLTNSVSCNVEITDRGPALWTGRIIDVSEGAARCLDMTRAGVVPVRLQANE
jgi:rare lipoprotein A